MKLVFLLVPVLLSACSTVPYGAPQDSAPSAGRDHRLTFYAGQRNLDEDDYDPVDEQVMGGAEYAYEPPGSIVGWEAGMMGSWDEEGPLTATTGELYGGVRKSFGSRVRPYIGAGVALIGSEVEVGGLSDDDGSIAGYAHAGVSFNVTPAFFIGLDLRGLFGSDLTIAGNDTDADYEQLALMAGWSF